MKAYVKIQSSKNIRVTSGLQGQDFTKTDSDIPNRLKVVASWPKLTVQILAGAHWYPSEIASWNTTKSLARAGILTIGEDSDEPGDCTVDKDELNRKIEEVKAKDNVFAEKKVRHRKQESLDELAE